MPTEEAWWIEAAQRGSEPAWRQLYDAAAPAVERYVRWRCGGVADLADDVLGEAWLVAVKRLSSYRPTAGPFSSWVSGIAAHCVLNALRKRSRRGRVMRSLQEGEDVAAGTTEAGDERVARALAGLSERYEQVLRAKYLDNLSVAALAALTNESPKAVESLLTRARDKFRAAYESEGE